MYLKIAISFLSASLLGGCATQGATLTVFSQPDGAYMTERGTGTVYGITPIVLNYKREDLEKHKDSKGCYLVKGFDARWVSGATSGIELITLCGKNSGSYQIGFARPAEYPDFEKDLNFSLNLKSVRAQESQAAAAKISAFNSSLPTVVAPKRCTSTQVGNMVTTQCF